MIYLSFSSRKSRPSAPPRGVGREEDRFGVVHEPIRKEERTSLLDIFRSIGRKQSVRVRASVPEGC